MVAISDRLTDIAGNFFNRGTESNTGGINHHLVAHLAKAVGNFLIVFLDGIVGPDAAPENCISDDDRETSCVVGCFGPLRCRWQILAIAFSGSEK